MCGPAPEEHRWGMTLLRRAQGDSAQGPGAGAAEAPELYPSHLHPQAGSCIRHLKAHTPAQGVDPHVQIWVMSGV